MRGRFEGCLIFHFVLFLFQFIFNILLPDHDAGVFSPPQETRPNNLLNAVVRWLVSGLHHWDAKYFIHIAHHGYTYENNLAFFPLLPICIRCVANTLFYPLQIYINYDVVLCLAALTVNCVAFIGAAVIFHRLSLTFMNVTLAYKATQLFCINPASIFFTAYYSESLFALVTFTGMLLNERGKTFCAVLMFALSGVVRSNGITNTGYIIYNFLCNITYILYSYQCNVLILKQTIFLICMKLMQTLIYVTIVFIPSVMYQVYSYVLYCKPGSFLSLSPSPDIIQYGNANNYKMAHTGKAEWCSDTMPLSYSYVQKIHWNNGLFNYYELKQIPNFLLATPIVTFSLVSVWIFMSNVRHNPSMKQYVSNIKQTSTNHRLKKLLRYQIISGKS